MTRIFPTNENTQRGGEKTGEIGFLKLRYKNPGDEKSKLIEQPLITNQLMSKVKSPSDSIRFSAAVAGFAQQLKGGKYLQDFSYQILACWRKLQKATTKMAFVDSFYSLFR